ncbi:redoxin domain-containing protein [Desulfocurvibacter africanus]|uniref:redoxin domain-containing protein n=1 Tax=Desulfocurvibacter africanus TaxID=873 RepID=UPI0004157F0D
MIHNANAERLSGLSVLEQSAADPRGLQKAFNHSRIVVGRAWRDEPLPAPRRKVLFAVQALLLALVLALVAAAPAPAQTTRIAPKSGHEGHDQGGLIWDPGKLPPRASKLKVQVGDMAPDFTLPSISGQDVSLSDFRGKKNVVLSFVPAAWTPVCSEQWPGYNLGREEIQTRDAVILGISVDNIPTLHAWAETMGKCWFPVLSDFHPQGEVASRYGVLRPEGFTERALFIIDKQGVIRYAEVVDINKVPRLETLIDELDRINKAQ